MATIKTYKVGNTIYKNLKELSTAAGIRYETAYKRMQRGWTDHEIFHGREKEKKETAKKKYRGTPVTVNGVEYESFKHAFDVILPKVKFNTARHRYEVYGWSPEESLGLIERVDQRTISKPKPKNTKRSRKPVVCGGKEYKSIAELAKEYNMSPALICNRTNMYGWELEKAISTPVGSEVIVKGIKYKSWLEAWENVGETSLSCFSARKQGGHDIEICLGLKDLPMCNEIEVNGKIYGSYRQIAESHNLTLGQLISRLKNMSLEEAVEYTPANGRYTLDRLKKEPEIANSIGYLYFVEIDFSDFTLHKIGITRKTVAERLAGIRYREILSLKGRLIDLYTIEQSALEYFSDYRYRADDEFEGKTETFLLDIDEEEELRIFIQSTRGHPQTD